MSSELVKYKKVLESGVSEDREFYSIAVVCQDSEIREFSSKTAWVLNTGVILIENKKTGYYKGVLDTSITEEILITVNKKSEELKKLGF